MTMEYLLEDMETCQKLASAATILVTYDYGSGATIPIPDNWRQVIEDFEGEL